MQPPSNFTAVFGAVTGFAGLAISFLNAMRSISKDRVNLKINFGETYGLMGEHSFYIEVVNLSTFPVTIAKVGLTGKAPALKVEPLKFHPEGQPFPRRLESRESLKATMIGSLTEYGALDKVEKAFACTECGETRSETNALLKSLIKQAKTKKPAQPR